MNGVDLPRGIRNHNPGNIRRTAVAWLGETDGNDKEFEIFEHPVYGLRALLMNLRSYMVARKLRTVRQIISRWAPPHENHTEAYISSVASSAGFVPDEPLTPASHHLIALARAIVRHENANVDPYPRTLYELAYQMLDAKTIDAAERMMTAAGQEPAPVKQAADPGDFIDRLSRLAELSALMRSELLEFEAQINAALANT